MPHLIPFNQKGSSHIVAVLAVVVIAAAGFVGYKVMDNETDQEKTADTSSQATSVPDAIDSTADLDQASTSLDGLDSDLNPDQLDEDLDNLL